MHDRFAFPNPHSTLAIAMSTQQKETFDIDGMGCEHCVTAVRDALATLDGVTVESAAIGHATVAYDADTTPRTALVAAIEDAGYTVQT